MPATTAYINHHRKQGRIWPPKQEYGMEILQVIGTQLLHLWDTGATFILNRSWTCLFSSRTNAASPYKIWECLHLHSQAQLSQAPIHPARTIPPGLAAPSSRDVLKAAWVHRGEVETKEIIYSRSCGKTRLSLEEASSQVVLKLLLRSSNVSGHFTTSVNENSVPSITWCYPISGSSEMLGAVPHTSDTSKRK